VGHRTVLWTALASVSLVVARGAPAQEAVADLYRQSYALEARGDAEGSLKAMDAIAARGGADYVVALRRGWLLYLAGRYAESEPQYLQAIAKEPNALEPKLGVMLPLMAMRRWKEAQRYGSELLKEAPGDSIVQGRMAYIHFMLGEYLEAESRYRKVVAAYPSNVEMRVGLAWSLLRQRRVQEARAEFDRVLAFAPDHASAKEGRAQIP